MRITRSFSGLLTLALLVVLAAGCSNDVPTSASATPGYSQTDVRVGSGTEVGLGSVLTVHYTGWLYDPTKTDGKGLQFETSRGQDPFSFTAGAGQVIAGWDQGLLGVKAFGIRRLVLPPSLAYGPGRNGPIPPNGTLVFDIEVLSVQ
jgi:FKBP-type peptidyl-prolyl cis-trans isomerase FkpA